MKTFDMAVIAGDGIGKEVERSIDARSAPVKLTLSGV